MCIQMHELELFEHNVIVFANSDISIEEFRKSLELIRIFCALCFLQLILSYDSTCKYLLTMVMSLLTAGSRR